MWVRCVFIFSLFGSLLAGHAATPFAEPVIQSVEIDGSNVNIRVEIDAGFDYLIYETKKDLRVGGAWVPRHSTTLTGVAETILLRMPLDPTHGCFRIRCYPQGELDLSLFEKTTEFERELVTTGTEDALRGGIAPGGEAAADGLGFSPGGDAGPAPEVSDSNIWAIREDRLYFYNRNRGLQIIDISDPDDPVILNTLPFAGQGERMFVLSSGYVALLATGWCNEDYTNPQDEVVLIDVRNDEAVIVNRLAVTGYVRESRLVGDALYVGSSGYFRSIQDEWGHYIWESRTYVTAFDLSDPLAAHQTGALEYLGYQSAVRAFPYHLVIVNNRWGQDTTLRVIDIDHTTAGMTHRSDISVPGYVRNEYMVDIKDGVLSVFSEVDRLTRLRNYDIQGLAPSVIGEVEVGHGESLFSARFYDGYAYAVTFLRIDPLWIIDNRDPANPTVSGELEVPGFSTYIHPFKRGERDQLLTIGTVSGLVAVSLFDTTDVFAPSLLSRIRVGEKYSWSEAQYEEQAFQVEEENGLVLLPFSSYGARGLQLIGLGETNLVEGGIVQTPVSVRRSAVSHERVVAVTSESLLTIDPADLQAPELTSELELSRQVSRLFVHDGFIIEVDARRSYFWGGSMPEPVTLTVRSTTNDTVLSQFELDPVNLSGATIRGDQLYTMQSDNGYGYFCCLLSGAHPTDEPDTNVVFSVFDLSGLPAITLLGQAIQGMTNRPNGELKALWTDDDTLVWSGQSSYYVNDWGRGLPVAGDALIAVDSFWYPWLGSSGNRFLAYDVADPLAPELVSDLDLSTTNWYGRTEAMAAAGKVYTASYQHIFHPSTNTNAVVKTGSWFRQENLTVLDYADPAHPVQRPPIEYTGQLIGVADSGRILYTRDNPWYNQSRDLRIHALAYDDVNVFPLDTLVFTSNYAQAFVDDDVLYIGTREAGTNELWTASLDAAHDWVIHDQQLTPNEYPRLLVNDLLILQGGGDYRFLGLTDRLSPVERLTSENGDSCSWLNVQGGDGSILDGFHAPSGWMDVRSFFFPPE